MNGGAYCFVLHFYSEHITYSLFPYIERNKERAHHSFISDTCFIILYKFGKNLKNYKIYGIILL